MTHSVQGWDPPRRIAPQCLHLPGPSGGLPDKGRLAGLPALPARAPLSHHSHLPFQDSCWSTEPKLLDLHPACLLQGLHHPDTHAQFLVIAGGVPFVSYLCLVLSHPKDLAWPGLPLHLGSCLRLIPHQPPLWAPPASPCPIASSLPLNPTT